MLTITKMCIFAIEIVVFDSWNHTFAGFLRIWVQDCHLPAVSGLVLLTKTSSGNITFIVC